MAAATTRWAGHHILPVREPGGGRDASEAGRVLAPARLADRAAEPSAAAPLHPRAGSPPLPLSAGPPAGEGRGEKKSSRRFATGPLPPPGRPPGSLCPGSRLRLLRPPPPLIPNKERKTRSFCACSVDFAPAVPPPGVSTMIFMMVRKEITLSLPLQDTAESTPRPGAVQGWAWSTEEVHSTQLQMAPAYQVSLMGSQSVRGAGNWVGLPPWSRQKPTPLSTSKPRSMSLQPEPVS
ncbi:PREDICTED: uncharacterized protein LOC103604237 [Galeopterus variegatus]|uniref:Uncharacterized protein LOC103604237 n=1 Tax=Galeopterus variegatus TaxID=482537 RepID=A0ABM0S2D4_GALVR|nr:PREDICTED: uncharacterized protein LOC103604237 [Galeopterus variegatus]